MKPEIDGSADADPSLKPKGTLKLYTLVGLIVANMIGAGVFTTSGFALADLGTPDRVMAAWLIGGIIALCGALSYGALAGHITESGGEYLFLSRIIHPLAGFLAGWISLLAGFTGAIAFAALAFETYMQPLMPFTVPAGALAVTIVIFAALLHGVKLNVGVGIQNIVVGLKFILILAFIGIAAVSFKTDGLAETAAAVSPFSLSAFAGSLVWISLSYSGYNAAVYVAGEAYEKKKLVPMAMWIGTLGVMVIYLLLNGIFMYFAPASQTAGREDVAAVAAMYIGGEPLALMVRLIIAVSLLTSVFAMIMIGPRVYARMADDGVFPSLFKFHGEVPRAAIMLQSVAAIILIAFSTVKDLLSYLGFTLSLCAAITVSCLFVLRRREGGSSLRIPGYPIIPAVFVAATIGLAGLSAWRSPRELIAFAVTIGIGSMIYYVVRRTTGTRP